MCFLLPKNENNVAPPKYVSEKTVPALRRHARDNGIQLPAKARKDEIVAAVAKHESRRMPKPKPYPTYCE